MACAGLSCRQGRAECKTPWTCYGYASEAHYTAMQAPVLAINEHDIASDEQRRAASQLGPPEYAAIAFCLFMYAIAFAHFIGAFE